MAYTGYGVLLKEQRLHGSTLDLGRRWFVKAIHTTIVFVSMRAALGNVGMSASLCSFLLVSWFYLQALWGVTGIAIFFFGCCMQALWGSLAAGGLAFMMLLVFAKCCHMRSWLGLSTVPSFLELPAAALPSLVMGAVRIRLWAPVF